MLNPTMMSIFYIILSNLSTSLGLTLVQMIVIVHTEVKPGSNGSAEWHGPEC